MTISRKYPLFLMVTTMVTAFAVFSAMREVLRSSLEKEILKRGEESAEAFALQNASSLLALGNDHEKARLQYNLMSLANDPDVVDAQVADTRNVVVAALSGKTGQVLPSYFTAPDASSHYLDPGRNAYHFRAEIRYANNYLGSYLLTMSRTPLEGPLRQATQRALVFAGGVALLMTIFGTILVRREIHPLKQLSVAFAEIAKGDFTQRVPEERHDEIGDLAAGFNYMTARAELFMHYNDKMIIERLIADETLARPGGKLRDLAVLFGDMRGYTAMSNRRNADQVVKIVNTYFHLFIECIAHWGGYVDKTMGDAIMALFERPEGDAIDSHKRRGLLCLCYMKAASRVLNHFLYAKRALGEELDIEPREFGFAMATGRAIVGNIGSVRRMDYTVCGRVVNLASRLEGLTKNGEVILDNFSLKGTSDLVLYETLPPVQPKGFSEAEKVIPHRITALAEEETQRLRIFLKKIFTYSFVREMLMPSHLSAGEEQPWCKEAELLLIRFIAETPPNDWFVRVDVESGRPLPTAPQPLGVGA
jgi:class 3 adenylate cyclase